MQTQELLEALKAVCGDAIVVSGEFRDELTVLIAPEKLFVCMRQLQSAPSLSFNMLCDITAVDYGAKKTERFEVIYHLFSQKLNCYLRVKCPLRDTSNGSEELEALPRVDTVVPLWRAADWLERETYDMFGINFVGHPNLKRILMAETMLGYPLRKDFPLHGPPEWPIKHEKKKRVKRDTHGTDQS